VNWQGQHWTLAVEDSETDMYLLRLALEKNPSGQQIICVRDGEQAIELLRELAVAGRESFPNLILLDLNMPRVDGYEVLTHLRSQNAFDEIPVVVVTSSQVEAEKRKALAVGADAYFVKPMDVASYARLPDVIDEARRLRSARFNSPSDVS
jgi:CheY-like chemotaxis protein